MQASWSPNSVINTRLGKTTSLKTQLLLYFLMSQFIHTVNLLKGLPLPLANKVTEKWIYKLHWEKPKKNNGYKKKQHVVGDK